ncbi:MAG: rod-binding protein [Roseiarcus sp.]|jgi:Rod binding domain-containing protein
MPIDPASDVVLEVVNAADPARAAAAAQRLNALAGAAAAQTGDFAQTLAQTAPSASLAAARVAGMADARSRLADATLAASDKAAKAQVDFEAVLLNGFVNEMLPKDASATFGQGLAGDMWKSMLADQMSRQIAKSGTLGIARRLFEAHPLSAAASLERASRFDVADAHNAAQMSANDLSLPSDVGHSDDAFLFADQRRT